MSFWEVWAVSIEIVDQHITGRPWMAPAEWIGELTLMQTPLSSVKHNGTRIPYDSLPEWAFRLRSDIKAVSWACANLLRNLSQNKRE